MRFLNLFPKKKTARSEAVHSKRGTGTHSGLTLFGSDFHLSSTIATKTFTMELSARNITLVMIVIKAITRNYWQESGSK
ncbi:MAG: hypothetical protein ACJAQ4_002233 [Cryomorphaceae bacterium]|jgi:hypothetical protein